MTKKYLLSVLLSILSISIQADNLVVVANPNSGIQQLNHNELVNIYLGRTKKLPSGVTALPIDLPTNSEQKKLFYEQLVHKSLPEIQAYWARLLFTGQATPPVEADNSTEVLNMITHNQGAIAYIDRKKVNSSVIIIYELNKGSN
ncbi:hypothetical protein DOJK_01903 [Patescibacteria group bacterium]|nr:hypothetical protein DOJK_01903 [Patescibacteria group bacterium]